MSEKEDIVFSRNTVEFVTVAAEFCAYIERANEPEEERLNEDDLEDFVTEDSYEVLRMTIFDLLTDKDSYLDVFVADMKYSDTPVTKSISEDLADIYQDIKNFVCLFKLGINETMHDAIVECSEHFARYWGQTLVNTMRALHEIRYNTLEEEEEEESNE